MNEREMPEGMPPIPEIRERIIAALSDARRENPLAAYYE